MARKTGTSTGTVITSPAKRKRQAAARRREEARWRELSGPVTVRYVEPRNAAENGPEGPERRD